MQIQLRPLQPGDQAALWPSYRAAFEPIIQAQFGGWDEREQAAAFVRRMAYQGFRGIWLGEQLLGAIRVNWEASPVELCDIWLAPSFHGRGIGAHLVRWVCDKAFALHQEVQLAVFFSNPAVRLYTRLGFRIVGQTEYQYLMRTDLANMEQEKVPANQ